MEKNTELLLEESWSYTANCIFPFKSFPDNKIVLKIYQNERVLQMGVNLEATVDVQSSVFYYKLIQVISQS